ncbi:MoxR family ATPase [Accumulibacter sp.]|uniref:AAA family ATPase n=1 Tax=Accumulibacter sp. TaxID=2053492 RepID=UPI0025D9C131|nr:MoxR family ATPase [Accumulibacter sp.]MCM8595751.1 MoxR family ATPase [Accumulibacter sp.]MCM8626600.1 MoxR family ATPase [Accumulibacter sp.]MDS4049899.1 MoxR family ATPase [Accumulibacter sp.]
MNTTLPAYDQSEIDLPAIGSWPASRHRFNAQQTGALRAAEAAGRPLLVRGDPGTGKSQLAHAAAVASGRLFLSVVVDSRSEASDLLWRFDAVARLADAQLAALPGGWAPRDLRPARYVEPGVLWWAFNWEGAAEQLAHCRTSGVAPADPEEAPADWKPERGTVVLIDEIDKAEADLPNGLLEALGNGRFGVPPLGRVVSRPKNVPAPLVIVTSNEERELPPAFVRRCLVLTLALPKAPAELAEYLVDLGRLHFSALYARHPGVLATAAEQLIGDRRSAAEAGAYTPGLAEYLDLLRVLERITFEGGGDPSAHLQALRAFFFDKQPPE